MKVLDITKLACAYLGLYDDYKNYFEPSVATNEEEILPEQIAIDEITDEPHINTMPEEKKTELDLIILSINNMQEKLLKQKPLITKQEVKVNDNKIEFSTLPNRLNQVLSIKSKNLKLSFKILDDFILVDMPSSCSVKEVEIEYSYYLPKVESLKDIVNLDNLVKEHTLALGVASEYCYISGLFDDAEIWNKKFTSELEKDCEQIKSFIMPSRVWR